MHDHITPVLQHLNWLSIAKRCQYKLLVWIFKVLHQQAPPSVCELFHWYTSVRLLRSACSTCLGNTNCTIWETTLRYLLLLSTHSSLIIGGSPLLLSDGGSPPASPASHLAGLLRRRDPSTNPGPIAWWVSVGN